MRATMRAMTQLNMAMMYQANMHLIMEQHIEFINVRYSKHLARINSELHAAQAKTKQKKVAIIREESLQVKQQRQLIELQEELKAKEEAKQAM